MEVQQLSSGVARERVPLKQSEKTEKPMLSKESALLFKEMYSGMLDAMKQREASEGADTPAPDFSAKLAAATPEMRSQIEQALKTYQGKLDEWTEKVNAMPEASRNAETRKMLEEKELKTKATEAMFEALSKADQGALEQEVASIPKIEALQKPEKTLEERTKSVEAWLGKDEDEAALATLRAEAQKNIDEATQAVQVPAKQEYDAAVASGDKTKVAEYLRKYSEVDESRRAEAAENMLDKTREFGIRKPLSDLIEMKLKTAGSNPHDLATASEQIQELSKTDPQSASEYHKQLVDIMTKPDQKKDHTLDVPAARKHLAELQADYNEALETGDTSAAKGYAMNIRETRRELAAAGVNADEKPAASAKAPEPISVAESYALAEAAKASKKPAKSYEAISPAAERAEPAVRELGIIINAEADTELAPEQEMKAKDSKRVMEYFSELPSWFKKGFSMLSKKLFEDLPPEREYGRFDNKRWIDRGGQAEHFVRAQKFDTSGEKIVAKPKKEKYMNQQEIASIALQMSDKLAAEYPNRVKEIELAGAKSTTPDLTYAEITNEMSDSNTSYKRKLDLVKELNARYEENRDYGKSSGNAQMEE